MLYRAKELGGFKLGATDGEIGKVKEFYFDDKFWTVRYLVADTGNWLTGRKVLISPYGIESIDTRDRIINTKLSKKQIEDSPSLDSDKPVSRQFEESYYGYYGWRGYWWGPYAWGGYYYPYAYPYAASGRTIEREREENKWDPNLRSSSEVSGYDIQATDGDIGHVDDFIVDDKTWMIRYLVVDTRDWWPGKHVLVSPKWIDHLSWSEKAVIVNIKRDSIKQASEYQEDTEITREYEDRLHRYYSREGYWAQESLQEIRNK